MFGFLKRNKESRPIMVGGGDVGWASLCGDEYKPLNKQAEVVKIVRIIADTVSNIPIMLLQSTEEQGKERVENGLSRKIDIEPHKDLTRKQFIFKIVEQMILTGNSIVVPEYSKNENDGYIQNLNILNDGNVRIDGKNIIYKNRVYKNDKVLNFILYPGDDNYLKGKGYVDEIKDIAMSLKTANDTKNSFLNNKYKPSVVISLAGDSEELQDEETRNKILNSYIGNSKAGVPWLIPADEMDVKTIMPLTLKDLAIIDGIKLDITRLASVLGVPKYMLGIGEFNKDEYNNFINTTILNITTIIEQELTKQLLYSNDLYFKFNIKKIMHHSLADKIAMSTELTSAGMLTRNEGRAMFDYSPIKGEGMDEIVVLENYIPISKSGKQGKLKGGE